MMAQKIHPRGVIWFPSIRPKFDDSNHRCSECSPSNSVVLAHDNKQAYLKNLPPEQFLNLAKLSLIVLPFVI